MTLKIKEKRNRFQFVIRTKIGNCNYKIEGNKHKQFCDAQKEGLRELEFIKLNTIAV